MRFNQNSLLGALILGSATLVATGCGSGGGIGSMLQDLKIRTYDNAGEQFVEATAQLSTGGLILAGLTVPIMDPKNPLEVYGQIGIQSDLSGGSNLVISANISKILKVKELCSA